MTDYENDHKQAMDDRAFTLYKREKKIKHNNASSPFPGGFDQQQKTFETRSGDDVNEPLQLSSFLPQILE